MIKRILSITICIVIALTESFALSQSETAQASTSYSTNSWSCYCPCTHGSYTGPSLCVTETVTIVREIEECGAGEPSIFWDTYYIDGYCSCSICGYTSQYHRSYREGHRYWNDIRYGIRA